MEYLIEEFITKKSRRSHSHIDNIQVFIETYLKNLLLVHPKIKSPIEKMFFIEWHYQKIFLPDDGYILIPQYNHPEITGNYMVDFMVIESFGETKIAVEIDGHDFHEKTKEQVRNDKKRERFITKNVTKVLRFSGSEVYKNPTKAVDEVMDLINDIELEKAENLNG